MANIVLEKIVKEVKFVKFAVTYICISSHGDCSAKFFGDLRNCYGGQWPLTGCYFKHC